MSEAVRPAGVALEREPHRQIPTRWWDALAAFLLLAALTTAASRLVLTQWTPYLGMVQTLAFLGVVAGLALGQSHFSSRAAGLVATIYGMVAVPWQLGMTQERNWLWTERLFDQVRRLSVSWQLLAQREDVSDPLLFLVIVAILAWVLSVYAGYALTRHGQVWRAVVPAGVAVVVIQAYDPLPARGWFLAIYVMLVLLLLARLTYVRNRARWRETDVWLPPYLGLEISRVVMLLAVALVLVAWLLPALSSALPLAEQAWDDLTERLEDFVDVWNNAFASLSGEETATGDGARYYGTALSLGRGNVLGDTPQLMVRVPASVPSNVRYYWRARVYDTYADGQWMSTFTETQATDPNDFDLVFPTIEGRVEAAFVFTPTGRLATLYVAPQPLWVSRPVDVDLAYNSDGTTDLSALHADPDVRADESYRAVSSLSAFNEAQLRAAGTDYPAWVASRYLQLPETITPRTRELAQQIAAGLETPYDKVIAVTAYLRDAIEYADTIETPPVNREPLDWFLFDYRQGFCNYYASSEIVMLRSLGIPARLAIGYARGTRQGGSNVYIAVQRDSHAWPEIYFPGLGWVEFEPTVSQPVISRPSGEFAEATGDGGALEPVAPVDGERDRLEDRLEELLLLVGDSEVQPLDLFDPAAQTRKRLLQVAIALLAAGVVSALAWRWGRKRGLPPFPVALAAGMRRLDFELPAVLRMWVVWSMLSPLERAYLQLNRALARLGTPPVPADTAAERVGSLERVLPSAAVPARQLLGEYHATVYGPAPGDVLSAQQAGRTIRDLSWQAVIDGKTERLFRPIASVLRFVAQRLMGYHHNVR